MAYSAVIKPVEGTILTVIREAAEARAGERRDGRRSHRRPRRHRHRRARRRRTKTPDLLPTLKQAGWWTPAARA